MARKTVRKLKRQRRQTIKSKKGGLGSWLKRGLTKFGLTNRLTDEQIESGDIQIVEDEAKRFIDKYSKMILDSQSRESYNYSFEKSDRLYLNNLTNRIRKEYDLLNLNKETNSEHFYDVYAILVMLYTLKVLATNTVYNGSKIQEILDEAYKQIKHPLVVGAVDKLNPNRRQIDSEKKMWNKLWEKEQAKEEQEKREQKQSSLSN